MKKNEFAQIKVLDLKELNSKTEGLRQEIANLFLDKNMKKLKDTKVISKKKKELAQILTVVIQKELLVQLESRAQKEDANKAVIVSKAKPASPTQRGEQSNQDQKLTKIAMVAALPRNDKGKGNKKI